MGVVLGDLEKYEDAIKAYEKVIEIDPDYVNAWYNIGGVLGKLKKSDEEIKAYKKVIEINPADVSAWYNMGVVLGDLEKYEKAIKAYEEAIEIDPDYIDAWNNIGNSLHELKKYKNAIKALEKAIKINPNYAYAWNNLGVSYENIGKQKEALSAYQTSIKLNPNDWLAYSNISSLYFDLGNTQDSLKNAQSALKNKKDDPVALVLKGRISLENKDYKAAKTDFTNAIISNPGNPLLILWKSYSEYIESEFSKGSNEKNRLETMVNIIRNLEKAEKLSKNKRIQEYILYFLASFYYKINDIFTAKEKLSKSIKLDTKSDINKLSRELLYFLWNQKIRPSWWQWWLMAPQKTWIKRVCFFVLILSIFSLLILHPFIDIFFLEKGIKINWTLYTILISLLIFILASPSLESIKTKEFELEMRSPPGIEPTLSPSNIEEKISEAELYTERKR